MLKENNDLASVAELEAMRNRTTEDVVNHPSHYINGNRETIDTIKDVTGEAFEGYLVGNILKYISRYKFKNGVEDLEKAQWYLNKLIKEQNENNIKA